MAIYARGTSPNSDYRDEIFRIFCQYLTKEIMIINSNRIIKKLSVLSSTVRKKRGRKQLRDILREMGALLSSREISYSVKTTRRKLELLKSIPFHFRPTFDSVVFLVSCFGPSGEERSWPYASSTRNDSKCFSRVSGNNEQFSGNAGSDRILPRISAEKLLLINAKTPEGNIYIYISSSRLDEMFYGNARR